MRTRIRWERRGAVLTRVGLFAAFALLSGTEAVFGQRQEAGAAEREVRPTFGFVAHPSFAFVAGVHAARWQGRTEFPAITADVVIAPYTSGALISVGANRLMNRTTLVGGSVVVASPEHRTTVALHAGIRSEWGPRFDVRLIDPRNPLLVLSFSPYRISLR